MPRSLLGADEPIPQQLTLLSANGWHLELHKYGPLLRETALPKVIAFPRCTRDPLLQMQGYKGQNLHPNSV